jgi:hypothetical protein
VQVNIRGGVYIKPDTIRIISFVEILYYLFDYEFVIILGCRRLNLAIGWLHECIQLVGGLPSPMQVDLTAISNPVIT